MPEAIPELVLGQRDRLAPVGWLAQGDGGNAQRRWREIEDAFDGRRVDRHRRGRQRLSEQPLRDEAAERVPDNDRRGVQVADDAGVVLDDVLDTVAGNLARFAPSLLDRAGNPRPAGREGRVTTLPQEGFPPTPPSRAQPYPSAEPH